MKILACPLASPGFSFPLVPIAQELAARGHTVRFLSERWLTPILRGAGLTLAFEGGAEPPCFEVSLWHHPGVVGRQLALLGRAMDEDPPDLLLTSALALGPLITAEKAGIPVVVVGLLTELVPRAGARREEFQVAWDACRAAQGLRRVAVDRLLGDLVLRRTVPELEDVPNPIGACSWEPPTPRGVRDWLDDVGRARVVYVQQARGFGASGFWSMLAEALPADVRVAASTSRMDVGTGGGPRGALVGPIVPQGAVLARSVAVLCSGTSAVALGAMERGVPMVCVPGGGEQHEIAALVAGAGLGVTVPASEVNPARLGLAFERALRLDPAPREAIREAFRRIDGPRRAASLIEVL